ncbi:MAG TPA: glutathione S-transferase family protein [Myxococcota bacterium]|nr:glutathione S-transferase family protein [Myxococcota bacterium]
MRLYEFAPTRSIRVRWVLQELGVPFDATTVDLRRGEHRRPEFLAINPAGKLPVLVDDGVVLTESIAIVLYLAEKFPAAGLLPRALDARAQAYRWLLFAATELEQPLWRIARHTSLYPEEERIPAEVPIAASDFCDMATVLDQHLEDREFVLGDAVSAADFALAYTLDWANEAKLLDGFDHARAYMQRMYSRPNAAPRIAAAFQSIGGRQAP